MNLNDERFLLRQEAFDFHRLLFGMVLCDCCRTVLATEYHEIVSRKRMGGASDEDKLASFAPELCSCLCRNCHERIAPTPAGRQQLLAFNISIYGYEAVEDALEAIPDQFRQDIELP